VGKKSGGSMRSFFTIILITILNVSIVFPNDSFDNPRVGIVISKASYKHHWGITQMAAHGWGGVVNLAGIPYDCLFIEDINPENNLKKYDCLIFGQCKYVSEENYNPLKDALKKYIVQGGNIILDGGLAYYDENTRERDHSELDDLLKVSKSGFKGNSRFRIKINENSHFITKQFEKNQYVTQHLVNGLHIQQFQDQGEILLELTDEKKSYPFLSVYHSPENRIVLVNDFSTWSGVPSFFRNNPPQVFYKNQIYNVLIETIYWSVYGDMQIPIPSLQVSNADLTAIIRLDADASGNLDAQIRTINYLNDIARETGVVSLYAWVSSQATKAGWQDLAPLGKKLEEAGGQIGTHSKFHRINQEMNEERWKEELDEAIREIEFNMSDYGYDIGKVDGFINPGNTIRMSDYNQVARRFKFYMTHGFEQDMPIGFGNFTWYTEDSLNFVVLENTPSPDYQWFYDPTWSYTTEQITAYQESIYDHIYNGIQRGAIINQMWHDYSITTQPQYGKDRIVNKSNIAMYDAIKSKFKITDIYCPTPMDLQNKLVMMAQGDYSWESSENELVMSLDISDVIINSVPDYTGGMGIRINNTNRVIQQVFINGEEHFGFNEDVVILPNFTNSTAEIKVTLGEKPVVVPHLQYVSKRMPEIKKSGNDLSVKLLTKSKARFGFYASSGYFVMNADWFEWNRKGDHRLNGYVTSDRSITFKQLQTKGLEFYSSDVLISKIKESETEVILTISVNGTGQERMIQFSSEKEVNSVLLNNQKITPATQGDHYILNLNIGKGESILSIIY
jgi:hypothetical protein